MGSDKKSEVLPQIIAGIVLAALVGGSSPWWWKMIFPSNEQTTTQTNDTAPPPAAPPPEPTADFPTGNRPVYAAEFLQWPSNNSPEGTATPENGGYVIRPIGSTWIGTHRFVPITAVDGDFLLNVHFRIEKREPSAAIEVELSGSGPAANTVAVFLEVWADDNVTYSLHKGWLKDSRYKTLESVVSDRVRLPADLTQSTDWSKTNKFSLKREDGTARLFVNDRFIKEFAISRFSVSQLYVAGAFPSTIVIESIELLEKA